MPVRSTFRSLQHRNFRLLFLGQLVSVAGTWAQIVAQGWLVLDLSDDSPLALGLVTGLQTAPMLLLGLWGGLLADRLDKRRLIIACQAGMGLAAAALAAVTLAGVVELWMVYVAVVVTGLCTVPDFPARQSFVSEVVPPDDLANAVSLNSAVFNAGRVVGPSVAGVLLATTSIGVSFAVNAASYAVVLVALWRMDTAALQRAVPLGRAKGQVREGLRYAWATPRVRANIALMAVMGSLGLVFQVLLPAFAKLELDGSATVYSLLAGAVGVGAVMGALRLAARRSPRGEVVVRAAVLYGAFVVAAALAPTVLVAVVLLVPVGWFMITSLSTSNALVQLDADPALRGRVTALRGLMVVGGAPIGGIVGGWVSEVFGTRPAIALGGVVTIAAALALAADFRSEPSPAEVAAGPAESTEAAVPAVAAPAESTVAVVPVVAAPAESAAVPGEARPTPAEATMAAPASAETAMTAPMPAVADDGSAVADAATVPGPGAGDDGGGAAPALTGTA